MATERRVLEGGGHLAAGSETRGSDAVHQTAEFQFTKSSI